MPEKTPSLSPVFNESEISVIKAYAGAECFGVPGEIVKYELERRSSAFPKGEEGLAARKRFVTQVRKELRAIEELDEKFIQGMGGFFKSFLDETMEFE